MRSKLSIPKPSIWQNIFIFANMILCIDTAIDRCGVGLCDEGRMIDVMENETALRASEILHTQIGQLTSRNKIGMSDLKAIAVNGGPGSYTGLRIGASAAKGLCYALDIPLIHIDGLHVMKEGVTSRLGMDKYKYYIPMIDARRDEVFTTVLTDTNETMLIPQAIILDADSFKEFTNEPTLIFGNGAKKASELMDSSAHATYVNFNIFVSDFSKLVWDKWNSQIFENAVTYVPNYLKKFHFTGKKNTL
ncbi:MAG: tRNA (adenosine(37)-N6)-threonylcarbamoyltransferase complex dimerization subunit type 1 TsaB [Bacteroidetes bacterium]|nr:tRNA (adenosine(37)-N6)-threonylcarbamoyltransferase complex dimerization subunit type 1 TsaB [Bacteroidota bacterium]